MSLKKIENYFTPNSVLDIGANIGQFYNEIKNIFPNSYYYLIEGSENCDSALRTLNVDYSICLLSDSEKDVDFFIRKSEPRCTGNSIYREKTSFYDDNQIIVEKKQTKTLSNLLGEKIFDLIKIDVQGSEIDIINGGLEIIKNAKAILMEVSLVEYNQGAPTRDFVYEYMNALGFEPVEIIGNINHPLTHELIQQDILFLNKKKMKKIALITSLFDYPESYEPSFYKNALKYFLSEDIHVVRNSGLITNGSYYDKLYFYKTVKVLEYIESNIIGKYEYILFLDATDTNFIKSPENVIEKFKSLNCDVVMGAEKGLWPPTNFTHLYENKRKINDSKYLNSGTYFGYTDRIVYHLRDIIEKEYQNGIDDQGKWTIQYLLNDSIVIDQERDFFFSTLDTKDSIKIEGTNVSLIGLDAFIIHDNGPHTENTIKLTHFLNENN